jgi:SAM-dependent methyltransferase
VLKKIFSPDHKENRMKKAGDLINARTIFLQNPSKNLEFLLANRFRWMNDFISETDEGLEVGCGIGVSKFYIKAKSFLLTDFNKMEWLDVKDVDALNTPFSDKSFNFVVSCNMLHHLPYPVKFLREMHRILKEDGVILIQDINNSLLCRFLIRVMRSEGYNYEVDVFDENVECSPTDEYWAGNNAIPNLLFDDRAKFEKKVPEFKIIKESFSELFIFINSGGVTAKTAYIPLPIFLLKFLKKLDDLIAEWFPQTFALQRQLVLKKG